MKSMIVLFKALIEIGRLEERQVAAKICRDKKPWGNESDAWAAKLLEEAASEIEQLNSDDLS